MMIFKTKQFSNNRLFVVWILNLFVLLLILQPPVLFASTKPVGKMVFTKGVVSLVKEDKTLQILGRGSQLFVGDLIRTGERSKAIIKLIDGTQLSLIENTNFIVKELSLEKNKEKADIHLLKGGLRAITGLVNKNNTGKFKLTTPVASIGIRGTDFTTYLCKENCKDKGTKTSKDDKQAVKARLLVQKGDVTAKDKDGNTRRLQKNSPLYVGDTIITARRAIAVVVFKDNSRTTIQPESQFLIEDYKYKPKKPKQNQASFKLIKGSLRFLTGEIGKLNREKYVIKTPTSSIGIRGTGFDLSFLGETFIFIWEGKVSFVYPKGELLIHQGMSFNLPNKDSIPKPVDKIPDQFQTGPRPDSPKISKEINIPILFGAKDADGNVGLYVHVTKGEVEIDSEGVKLNLGQNESGFLGENKQPHRINTTPDFLVEPFIPPNLDQKELTKLTTFSKVFENAETKENGNICEVK